MVFTIKTYSKTSFLCQNHTWTTSYYYYKILDFQKPEFYTNLKTINHRLRLQMMIRLVPEVLMHKLIMNGPQKSQHFTFIGCRGLLSWNRVRLPIFIYSPNSIMEKIVSSFCLFE